MKTREESSFLCYAVLAGVIIFLGGCLVPPPESAFQRDLRVDRSLSTHRIPEKADDLSDVTGEPQEGRFQEPSDDIEPPSSSSSSS